MAATKTPDDSNVDLLEILDDVGEPPTTPPAAPTDEAKRKRRKILMWLLIGLLVIFAALVIWYLLNRKPLSELPGLNEAKPPAYKTSIYGVTAPLGVAVSPDGSRIYATQSGAKPAAFVFDRDGKKLAELKPPSRPVGYHVPVYLAVNPTNGDVYVGDRAAGAIYIYDASGAYLSTFAPKGDLGAFSPLGLAVAKDGTLYVADALSDKPAGHRILVFGKDGSLVKTLGKGELNYPNAIVAGTHGEIYVSDSNNGRVVVIDSSGKVTSVLARGIGDGDLGLPRGMAIDDSGRLFVVDTTDHMVRLFTVGSSPTAAPSYVASFGDQGREDGQFMFPNGLATDTRGRVYITDRDNNRIQVWGY